MKIEAGRTASAGLIGVPYYLPSRLIVNMESSQPMFEIENANSKELLNEIHRYHESLAEYRHRERSFNKKAFKRASWSNESVCNSPKEISEREQRDVEKAFPPEQAQQELDADHGNDSDYSGDSYRPRAVMKPIVSPESSSESEADSVDVKCAGADDRI